jgi:hypothetical protein
MEEMKSSQSMADDETPEVQGVSLDELRTTDLGKYFN